MSQHSTAALFHEPPTAVVATTARVRAHQAVAMRRNATRDRSHAKLRMCRADRAPRCRRQSARAQSHVTVQSMPDQQPALLTLNSSLPSSLRASASAALAASASGGDASAVALLGWSCGRRAAVSEWPGVTTECQLENEHTNTQRPQAHSSSDRSGPEAHSTRNTRVHVSAYDLWTEFTQTNGQL